MAHPNPTTRAIHPANPPTPAPMHPPRLLHPQSQGHKCAVAGSSRHGSSAQHHAVAHQPTCPATPVKLVMMRRRPSATVAARRLNSPVAMDHSSPGLRACGQAMQASMQGKYESQCMHATVCVWGGGCVSVWPHWRHEETGCDLKGLPRARPMHTSNAGHSVVVACQAAQGLHDSKQALRSHPAQTTAGSCKHTPGTCKHAWHEP